MGDRANVLVKDHDEDPGVYLYTHWHGYELPATVQRALASQRGRNRWNDGPYLARIIFCEMIKDDVLGEMSYGISSRPCDGQDRVVMVNAGNRTVTIGEESWTFEGYCSLPMSQYGWSGYRTGFLPQSLIRRKTEEGEP